MTERLYYSSSQTVGSASVLEVIDGERPVVVLDRTHFHPQGGGQKADTGWIQDIEVVHVAVREDSAIVHRVDTIDEFSIGQEVEYRIRFDRRQHAARLHSAGHLIAPLVQQIASQLRPKGAHHWPGEARVDFAGAAPPDESFEAQLRKALTEAIDADLPVSTKNGAGTRRTVQIGSFEPIPCGGCHVSTLGELRSVQIRKIRFKKGVLRIGYDVERVVEERTFPDGLDCLPTEESTPQRLRLVV